MFYFDRFALGGQKNKEISVTIFPGALELLE